MTRWALVSVYDKTGVIEFAQSLAAAGYGILSTGGTAAALREAGMDVTAVEDYTGFPEMMGGRVKTLHPKVHGGLLGVRDNPEHAESMRVHGIDPIDVVVVNLYPFAQTAATPDATFEQVVEMIDIGGPSMLRSAAKNHRDVVVVTDPADYGWLSARLQAGEPITAAERAGLAAKVFARTSAYDAAIAEYLARTAAAGWAAPGSKSAAVSGGTGTEDEASSHSDWPSVYSLTAVSRQALRYGENPHQAAHFYQDPDASPASIARAVQLQGKELSYNNIQDSDAALRILRELDDLSSPAVVAVKHMNPCGVGLGSDLEQAFDRAYEADPVSIFGGIIACNRPVDEALAERLTGMFLEIVIAPSFTEAARQRFARKKNVRLLTVDMSAPLWRTGDRLLRRVSGGLLVQAVDTGATSEGWRTVTDREPTADEREALRFAWKVVKHVKSNAIVLANAVSTLGVGAGQMNRVGAAEIAIRQAGKKAAGSVLASDAFFPMRDTVDAAAAAGVRAIVQPGGSIRDDESIAAANEHGIAMVFTGVRHFLH
ncbi:MAG: bifunctional phosphoribosylaminoimidazolecarboxamide formyltransferase/IMP cyclohydrolase [Alicyclobacillus sp.]|nr:bifunctional phosphoribosylaminoimidazolecarboxamide formyltransferase/IMP cyclohydrolase [Alicyclobacillus sp.]